MKNYNNILAQHSMSLALSKSVISQLNNLAQYTMVTVGHCDDTISTDKPYTKFLMSQ